MPQAKQENSAKMPGSDFEEDHAEATDLNFGFGEVVAEEDAEEVEAAEEKEEVVKEEVVEGKADDAEETEEAEAVVEKPEPKKKQLMVPKSRLDEVLAKNREFQRTIEAMKAAAPVADEEIPFKDFDFDEKELEYQQHVLDGEKDKALGIRKEIRAAEKAQNQYEFSKKVGGDSAATVEQTALVNAAREIEAMFPVFDNQHKDFNAKLAEDVVAIREGYQARGMNVVEALNKAVEVVVKINNLDGDVVTTEVVTTKKKQTSLAEKVKAAAKQPMDIQGQSNGTTKHKTHDIENMSDEEFNALPAATLARYRGDIL